MKDIHEFRGEDLDGEGGEDGEEAGGTGSDIHSHENTSMIIDNHDSNSAAATTNDSSNNEITQDIEKSKEGTKSTKRENKRGVRKHAAMIVHMIPPHTYKKWLLLVNEFYTSVRSKDKDFEKELLITNGNNNYNDNSTILKRRIPYKEIPFQFRSEPGAEEAAEEAISILTKVLDETRNLFRLGHGRTESEWSDDELLSNEMVMNKYN